MKAALKSGESNPLSVKTLDLSRGGALLDCPSSPSIGQLIKLSFQIESERISGVEARVKRVHSAFGGKRFTVAVEFKEPNKELMTLAKRDLQRKDGEFLKSQPLPA